MCSDKEGAKKNGWGSSLNNQTDIFIPCHVHDNHWVLVYFNVPKKEVSLFDSLHQDEKEVVHVSIHFFIFFFLFQPFACSLLCRRQRHSFIAGPPMCCTQSHLWTLEPGIRFLRRFRSLFSLSKKKNPFFPD